jgi:hypothetical protein
MEKERRKKREEKSIFTNGLGYGTAHVARMRCDLAAEANEGKQSFWGVCYQGSSIGSKIEK